MYVPAKDKTGNESPLNAVYGKKGADPMALGNPLSRGNALSGGGGLSRGGLPGLGGSGGGMRGGGGGLLGALPGVGRPGQGPAPLGGGGSLGKLGGPAPLVGAGGLGKLDLGAQKGMGKPENPFAKARGSNLGVSEVDELGESMDDSGLMSDNSLVSPLASPGMESLGDEDLEKMEQQLSQIDAKKTEMLRSLPHLSRSEKMHMEQAFARLDQDGNGSVAYDEFNKALSNDPELCGIMSRGILSKEGKSSLTENDKTSLWQIIDKNQDERLTMDEVHAVWKSEHPSDQNPAGQQPSLAVNIAGVEPVGQDIDSPGSIPSDDALEVGDYEESFESDLNSDDIAAEESLGEQSSLSPLSSGWNVDDTSASVTQFNKLGYVEDVDRVKR